MQSKTKAPFGWVGGKSKLAKDIVTLMPEHRRYIEVFGGSLSVLYAKPKATGAGIEIVNDINSELINLHRAIRNYPDTLSIYLNQLLTSREIFADIKNKRLTFRNVKKQKTKKHIQRLHAAIKTIKRGLDRKHEL